MEIKNRRNAGGCKNGQADSSLPFLFNGFQPS
jgi:hypothetical protein